MNFLNKLQPKIVIAVALIVGALMVVSAFIELKQSKEEIFQLLIEQVVFHLQYSHLKKALVEAIVGIQLLPGGHYRDN